MTPEEVLKEVLTLEAIRANNPDYTFNKVLEAMQRYAEIYHLEQTVAELREVANYIKDMNCISESGETFDTEEYVESAHPIACELTDEEINELHELYDDIFGACVDKSIDKAIINSFGSETEH